MFRWFLTRVGLPVGVLLGVGFGLRGSGTALLDVILTIMIPAVALASLLSFATQLFVRTFRRTRITATVLVAGIVTLTVVGGAGVLVGASHAPHGRWNRLPDPPAPAVSLAGPTCYRMVGDDDGLIVVAAQQGGYFVYRPGSGSSGVWTREAAIPEDILQRSDDCRVMSRGGAIPRVRGGVLATYRVDDDGVDCGGRRHYILKEDGTVWEWSTGGCAITYLAGLAFYVTTLLAVGLAAGIGRLSDSAPFPWPRQ